MLLKESEVSRLGIEFFRRNWERALDRYRPSRAPRLATVGNRGAVIDAVSQRAAEGVTCVVRAKTVRDSGRQHLGRIGQLALVAEVVLSCVS